MIGKTLQSDLRYTLSKLSVQERRKLDGATILMTGCSGFLGYSWMHFLLECMEEIGIRKVIALDNFMLGRPKWMQRFLEDGRFQMEDFDIISGDIQGIHGAAEADYVVHMASIASPTYYRKYPIETLDANVWGLRRLLDFYKARDIRGFLFYSSSEIYGDPDGGHIPTDETYRGNVSPTGPRACYDEAKRFGETMCMLFHQEYGIPVSVVRPFNNYGPGMRLDDRRAPADFACAVHEGKDIVLFSDGSPTRTFCYVADAMAGYWKALLHGGYDCFNIGIEAPEISMRRLADIYAEAGREICGYAGHVRLAMPEDRKYLTDNPQRRCPSIRKARQILGYCPEIGVEDGVRRFLSFLQESEEGEYRW